MVKDHSDSEKGNPLPPHRLLFPINSKVGVFYMYHSKDRITHTTAFVTPVVEHWQEGEIAQWVYPMKDQQHVSSLAVGVVLYHNPLSYFSFQPVLHDWCNKGRGMCYPVCGMVHIKEHLLLIGKSSLYGGSRFPLSLSEWSFTICLTPYNVDKMC